MASRIDVSIEHRGPEPETARDAPEHLPELQLPLPGRGARREPPGLPALRPPLPGACAQARRAARRSRHLRGGGRGSAFRGPARLLRPARVHGAARRGRGRDGPRRRADRRRREHRAAAVRARGHGLRVHGRLDGERRRREVRPRLRAGGRARRAARLRHRLRRRAHAGGDPLAHAAAEDGCGGRPAARGACRRSSRS